MKIYEQSKDPSRRSNNCGYCRQPGHNRTECPEVAKDWAYFQDFQIPPNRGAHSWYRSRTNPKYWGEWYHDCKNTYHKQLDAKAKKKAPVQRSAPKCGFCGSTSHNRRNCNLMKSFLADCYRANENWRRAAYKHIVSDLGLDVGAAVSLRKRRNYYGNDGEYDTHVGLITSINWDNLNIMTAFRGSWDNEQKYGQHIDIRAMVDGEDKPVSIKDHRKGHHDLHSLISEGNSSRNRYWSCVEFHKVIGKSEKPLSEEWVTSYRDAFDFLVKKRSFERLQEDGIVALIDKWK